MKYTKDNTVYSEPEVRAAVAQASLPEQLLPEHVAPYGFAPYTPPEPSPPTLDEAKAAKRAQIKAWRDAQEARPEPIACAGTSFDADPASRERIQAVLMLGVNPLGTWTDAANADQPMTHADLQGLFALIVQRGAQIHAHQRTRKAALDALSDLAAVLAFDPGEGWA